MKNKDKIKRGERALLEIDGLKFPVKIIDWERRYGRRDFLVVPVGGEGERFVMEKNLTFLNNE